MNDSNPVRAALERNVNAVSRRRAIGRGTARTVVRWSHGLTCEAQDGPWKLTIGMTDKYGGDNAGPNPGVYGRTALGSCLVIGYAMWAARMGIELKSLSVEVEADYDVGGELGIDPTVRPGYQAMRYIVSIESDAPEEDVIRMLDQADKHSSYLDDFANPVPVERVLKLVPATST
jgi:uncharacterized OsmC-like protein